MNQVKVSTLALALSGLAAATVASEANANPFSMTQLASGYQLMTPDGGDKAKEAKCGAEQKMKKDGKCGAEKKAMKEGKCGEGKCGADKAAMKMEKKDAKEMMKQQGDKMKEGTCGADHKMQHEGKCGNEKGMEKKAEKKPATPL
ncbi:HvfA family oxazolone/thioamide-modified RiPP metallophore [Shewanella mangrovi]|uniref:HvfA family oxazolone/thioamide-modified RiPP metallophore n=1 Tax=Shewanella mangrovi TaxID=1515746 RepID=UPI00055E49AE|nr:hypothetical protein [Shewanella mangrovi]